MMRRIRIAAYDGNRLAKGLIAGLHLSRQAWHVFFGHMSVRNVGLPCFNRTQFLIVRCKDVAITSYWTTCPCGITEHVYQAMETSEVLE